ncbi:hypothetical protein D6C79_08937 [Aureobasidium pullulans]|nr:hypothetical protein D6C79_08937 [Aureobasidium pullulans]
MRETDDLNRSKAINIINDRGDTHDTSRHSETPVSNASLAGGSPSLIGDTTSRAVSQGKVAPSKPSVSTNFSSVAPSVSDARGNYTSSAISIEKRNSGVPGLGRNILFNPDNRPSLQEIAKAAQIEFSALSDETKAIMGYAIERPAVDRTLASISEPRLYSEGGISRAIIATAAGPTVEAGAEHNNNKRTLDPASGEAPDARLTPVATIAAGVRGKRLAAALDEIEEGDMQPGGDDSGYVARVEARVDRSPAVRPITPHRTSPLLTSIPKSDIGVTAPPTKRVHFLTLETLVDHTSKHLERYNDKKISGPVLSMSFVLLHASFSSSPANPAKLLSTLEDFKRLLTLLLEKLREFLRTAQTPEGAAISANLFGAQVVLAKKDMEFLERCV